MQRLDLTKHTPAEFEGKFVALDGANYIIGPLFREGDQGFAHYLINQQSNLCLHFIQIRPEYQSDPELAKKFSQAKAEQTAELRTQMRMEKPEVATPNITVVEAYGGSFELHETRWGSFGKEVGMLGANEIRSIVNDEVTTKTKTIIDQLKEFLQQQPHHTEAMILLADCLANNDNYADAINITQRAVNIEPNSIRYLGLQILHLLNGGYRFYAKDLFVKFRSKYPLVDDHNLYGIEVFLACGEAEHADELLRTSHVSEQDFNVLNTITNKAISANKAFAGIESRVRSSRLDLSDQDHSDLIAELKDVLKLYPQNPWIQINLGLTLRDASDAQAGQQLLSQARINGLPSYISAYCAMNSGFCFVKMKDWDAALHSFDNAIALLGIFTKDNFNTLDVPGYAHWIFKDGQVSEHAGDLPEQLVMQAVEGTENPDTVTPNVLKLLSFFKETSQLYKTHETHKPPQTETQIKVRTPPFALFLSMGLASYMFVGAVVLFSAPITIEKSFMGVLFTTPVLFLIYLAFRRYGKGKNWYSFLLFVPIPILAFLGGTIFLLFRG